MDYFDRLLADMPGTADVWADAERRYGRDTPAALRYAANVFEGLYLHAKLAFASLLDPPDDEDDDDGEPDTGDPGAELAALEVPALEELDALEVWP